MKTFTTGMKAWSAMWMEEGQHHSYAKSNKILAAIESFKESSNTYNRMIPRLSSVEWSRIRLNETECGKANFQFFFCCRSSPSPSPPPQWLLHTWSLCHRLLSLHQPGLVVLTDRWAGLVEQWKTCIRESRSSKSTWNFPWNKHERCWHLQKEREYQVKCLSLRISLYSLRGETLSHTASIHAE